MPSAQLSTTEIPILPAVYRKLTVDQVRVNRVLEAACKWGSTPDGGMARLALNSDDRDVRRWFIDEAKRLGCSVKIDEMGNIFAIRPGKNEKLPPIALGSHLDTQPTGGKYDGILGIVAALEVLQVICDNGIETHAPLAIVNWTNEEGARFQPSMLGSGVWAGAYSTEFGLSRKDIDGITVKEELVRHGFLGDVGCSYEANPLLAHLELHIEQGPELDEAQQPAAVVRGIQGIKWFEVEVVGRRAHTGTTPMNRRCDPLLGVAKMIVAANEIVLSNELTTNKARSSIAVIRSEDFQSMNTLLGEVCFGLDLRAPLDEDLNKLEELCRIQFADIAQQHGLTVKMKQTLHMPTLHFDPTVINCVRSSAKSMSCTMELISGAGHDSAHTSRKVPTGMVFARCRDGISHNPSEYTRPDDCAAAAQVLLGAYLRYEEHIKQKYPIV